MKTHKSSNNLSLSKNPRKDRSSVKMSMRLGSIAILFLLAVSISYFGTSASSSKKGLQTRESLVPRSDSSSIIGSSAFTPVPPPAPEALTTYAQNCLTPKTVFQVGDTVCVKATDVPVSFLPRRLDWATTDQTIVKSVNIPGSSITDSFVVNATTTVGSKTIDSRGVWQIAVINPFFRFPEITTRFTVVDAANPKADLGVSTTLSPNAVEAGAQAVFQLQVTNFGPDPSLNVNLTDTIPAGTTLVSFEQISGPGFVCENGVSATTCTIASLSPNDPATFVATYSVNGGASVGDEISNTATVASLSGGGGPTADPNSANDSTTGTTTVTATPCVLTCPSNIIQDVDAGQAGAFVTFPAPTGSNANVCGPDSEVVTTPASGSFFPTGTTPVTATSSTGGAICTFLVIINNPGALSISLNGPNPATAECGDDFTDPGATAVDGSGQSVPVDTVFPSGFDPSNPAVGSYVVTYTATQGSNSVSTTRTVNVTDTEAPSITLSGANPYRIVQGSCLPFVEPGVAAFDGCAGAKPVTTTISGPGGLTHVDNNVPGTYTLTYTATDGTHQRTATRTVLVGQFSQDESDQADIPTPPPTVTLNGDDQITIECGTAFTDPGATATSCGNSVAVTTSGTVDVHTPGNYTITYTATNTGGTSTATRHVTVSPDNSAPVIQVLGANPMTVECHTSFTDPGATAHDACAGDFAATASGTVNPNVVGTYVITYNATDPSGFSATPVTRTVNVVDTTNPVVTAPPNVTVFTGSGSTSCSVVVSNAALGTATASDSCSGSLSVTRSGVPAGNSFPVGTTTITYSATDPSNNTGTATQTVTVVDNTAPVITTNGQTLSMWPPNHKYQTFQVTSFVTGASDNCTSLGVGNVVIEKVTSDEIENGNGDGNTTNDIVIAANCKSVQLRSEREGNSDGRVYTITFKVTDASGNVGRATATVVVNHNPGENAVNSGVHYTVNGTCP